MSLAASSATGRKLFFLILSLVIGTGIIVPAAWMLVTAENERFAESRRSELHDRLGVIRADLESALNSRLAYLSSLTAFVSSQIYLEYRGFESLAKIIVRSQPGIRSVELAENNVITHVYPLTGNEAVLGLELEKLPADQLEALHESMSRHQTVVAGPVDLVQGGIGIIGRAPVFKTDPGKGPGFQAYWGQAMIIIDAPRLFEEAGLHSASDLRLAIFGKDGKGEGGGLVYGDPALPGEDPVWLDVNLPIGSWRLYGLPAGGVQVSPRSRLIMTLASLAWPFVGLGLWGLFLWPLRLKEAVETATLELKAAHDGLEHLVAERTAELRGVNERLTEEVAERAAAQAALRVSETRFRKMFENHGAVMLLLDPTSGEIVEANRSAVAFYGYAPEEFPGMPITRLNMLPEPEIIALMQDVVANRQKTFTFPHRLADGRIRTVETYSTPIELPGRTLLFSIVHDITERWKAEQALRESEAVLRNLYEQAPMGIFESTPDGRYLRVNAALAAMYGYDSPEAMLREVVSIKEQIYVDQQDRLTMLAELEEQGSLRNFEIRRKRKDGEIIWVSLNTRVQRGPGGEVERYEGFSTDITRRKRAEESLRESEARFRRLFHTMPVPLALADNQGRIVDSNERFTTVFGYEHDDIPDIESWWRLAYPDPEYRSWVMDAWAKALKRAMRDKTEIEPSEYLVTCKNGDKRTVLVSGILGEDGLLATFHDITERKQAEEALAVRERQMRVIFENSPLGLVYFDDQGAIKNCNDAFLEQMHATRDQIVGRNFIPRFPEEVRRALLQALSGRPSEYKGRYTSLISGKELYVHALFNPVNRGQPPSEVIASVEDVTAQREREDQLTRLWKIVEQSPASIVITDAAGNIEYVNPYFTLITGYTAEEALGKNPKILKSEVHSREFYEEMWKTLLSNTIWRGEICNRKKNGEIYWEDASISPIFAEDGKITHFVAVKEDITEKKAGETRLKNTLAELEAIFNASSVGIAHVSEGMSLQRVNNRFQEVFGFSEPELSGAPLSALFLSPEAFANFMTLNGPRLAALELIQGDVQLVRQGGGVIWCSIHARLIDPAVPETGSIWVFDDITARKDLDTLREDVERIMRHDLKGPLNGIINLPGLVAAEGNLNREQTELLEFITESGQRMLDQIELSLDLYKLEMGEFVLAPTEIDLCLVIERVTKELGTMARAREVTIETSSGGLSLDVACPVPVTADQLLCHTIFTNLIKNAIEASQAGQTVGVRIEAGDEVVISVRNPAVVPEDFLPVFFEKYTTSGKKGGTGLGTYSARLMTRIQHGRIAVASSAATGTTVTVSLPGPTRPARANPNH